MSPQPEQFEQLLELILKKEETDLTEEEKEVLRQMIRFWAGFKSVWSFVNFIAKSAIWIVITIGSVMAVWSQIKDYINPTGGG
jgi:hypothetical protein